jgi:hypothetical protein
MAADIPPLDEAALPATETGPWSGGADGECGARCGAGRLTRDGLPGCALPSVSAAGAAGDAVGGEGAGRANEGAGVAGEPGTAGRNPTSITGACEGSLRLATCSGARAARGSTVGSSLCASTAGFNARGGAAGGDGTRGTATSGCDSAAAGWGAGSWASAGGRAPASADDGRMAVALGSVSAGVSEAVAGGVLVALDVDPLGVGFCFAVLDVDPLGVGLCFAVLDVDPLGVGFCLGGFCFLSPRAFAVSAVPVPVLVPVAEVPSFDAGVGAGPGGTVVPVGSGCGVVPVGAAVVPGSGGAGAAGSAGDGWACASPATVVVAVSATSSSTTVSTAAEAGVDQASVTMRTTPAHAARHTMNDAPGPRVVNRHPFALPCDATATVPCPRLLV